MSKMKYLHRRRELEAVPGEGDMNTDKCDKCGDELIVNIIVNGNEKTNICPMCFISPPVNGDLYLALAVCVVMMTVFFMDAFATLSSYL